MQIVDVISERKKNNEDDRLSKCVGGHGQAEAGDVCVGRICRLLKSEPTGTVSGRNRSQHPTGGTATLWGQGLCGAGGGDPSQGPAGEEFYRATGGEEPSVVGRGGEEESEEGGDSQSSGACLWGDQAYLWLAEGAV
jgi:hypothetical protein